VSYYVTYRETGETDEATHNSVQHLNDCDEPSDLAEIIDQCAALEIEAELFDAAGFRRGWVHKDGSYSLQ
jgi:hypothetical protein